MSLPLMIQMQIDLTAQAHKREIAQGFAKLRARLLPEAGPSTRDWLNNAFNRPLDSAYLAQLQAALMPAPNAMMQRNQLQAANVFWTELRPLGLEQSLFGGLGL